MIRRAKLEDAQMIRELNQIVMGYDTSLEQTTQQLTRVLSDERHIVLIAENEQHEICGYLHADVYQTLYAESMFNILGLAVFKEYQRQGIATQLMHALMKLAKEKQFKHIRLNSGQSRLGAHAFYRNVGFTSEKEQRRFLMQLE